jgi:hypothetical protein
LNIYGFTRIIDGTNKNCYFHEFFLRDQEHLLHKIIHIPTKKDATHPSRALIQLPDTTDSVVPDSSLGASNTRLLATMLHHGIQYRPGNVSDNQPEIDLERHIEQLRRVNRHYLCQAIQLEDAIDSHRDSLWSHPLASTTSNGALLSQIIENRPSLPMMAVDTDLMSVLAQLQAPIAVSLQPRLQPPISEWLRQQFNQPSTSTQSVTNALTQINQILSSPLESDLHTRLVVYLQQREALNRSQGLGIDLTLMSQLEPNLINQLSSLADRNASIQSRALEHPLNADSNDSRIDNAMSLFSNALGGLTGNVTSDSGRPVGRDGNVRRLPDR